MTVLLVAAAFALGVVVGMWTHAKASRNEDRLLPAHDDPADGGLP